jgi:hypothetical protein
MPVPITFREFCGIAMVTYHTAVTRAAGGFVRYTPMDRWLSGFQGAILSPARRRRA